MNENITISIDQTLESLEADENMVVHQTPAQREFFQVESFREESRSATLESIVHTRGEAWPD